MKFLLFPILICLGAIVRADTTPAKTTAEEEARRIAELARTPEELALRQKATDFIAHISDAAIAGLHKDDPLLRELYARRIGGSHYQIIGQPFDGTWDEYVDRDIQRRADAMDVLVGIMREPKYEGNRGGVMSWVSNHREVPWALALLEEGIRHYRSNPKAWEYAEVGMLDRLVASIGYRRHATVFDDIDASGIGANGRASFENRMKLAGEGKKRGGKRTPQGQQILSMTAAEVVQFQAEEKAYAATAHKASPRKPPAVVGVVPKASLSDAWEMTVPVTIIMAGAALGLLWLVWRNRKRPAGK